MHSVDEEDSGVITPPTPHCIKVDAENEDIYLSAETGEDMNNWKDEFYWRIKAMQRIMSLRESQKNSSSSD